MRDAIKRSIDAYARDGVPTGGFLRAVLEHLDVFEVFARADEENQRDMREILCYVHNEIPGNCHGSPEVVEDWIDAHRKARERAESDALGAKCDTAFGVCLLYTSPSPRDGATSRMPSSA